MDHPKITLFGFFFQLLILYYSISTSHLGHEKGNMLPKPKLNVQKFPRPPLLERTNRHLEIKWHGLTVLDTKDAWWVLETHHPPTYYIPPTSLSASFPLSKTPKSTYCEWKGHATYHSITHPVTKEVVANRIWSYENPNPEYKSIKDYVSFYAGPWQCFVDGEEVKPQPGDFYGGWTTSELEGIIKGDAATRWM